MMESCMRQGLTLVAVFIGAGLGLGITFHDAGAGPLPAVSLAVVAPVLVIEAGWRRNWRRYGPDVVIPDPDVDVDGTSLCLARHLP